MKKSKLIKVLKQNIIQDAVAALKGADLSNEDLSGISFANLNLEGCNFSNSILENCSFVGADLDGTNFVGTTITGSNFNSATMRECVFVPKAWLDTTFEGTVVSDIIATPIIVGLLLTQGGSE